MTIHSLCIKLTKNRVRKRLTNNTLHYYLQFTTHIIYLNEVLYAF